MIFHRLSSAIGKKSAMYWITVFSFFSCWVGIPFVKLIKDGSVIGGNLWITLLSTVEAENMYCSSYLDWKEALVSLVATVPNIRCSVGGFVVDLPYVCGQCPPKISCSLGSFVVNLYYTRGNYRHNIGCSVESWLCTSSARVANVLLISCFV
jgi:hypothetical protein